MRWARLYALSFGFFLVGIASGASCPELVVHYSFNPLYPARSAAVAKDIRVALPDLSAMDASHGAIRKTIFALKLVSVFQRAIEKVDRNLTYQPWPWTEGPIYRPMLDVLGLPQMANQIYEKIPDVEAERDRGGAAVMPPAPPLSRNRQLAHLIRTEFELLRQYLERDSLLCADAKLVRLTHLGTQLADNIENWNGRNWGFTPEWALSLRAPVLAAAPKGLGVTAGGAQDAQHFRMQIEAGNVPEVESFSADGMLRELNLTIPFETQELLAVQPGYLVDPRERMIYLQLDTSSAVTPERFVRNPANITFVLDISGSMGALDEEGSFHTRLDWAKSALITMLRKLRPGDSVSILLFDDKTKEFLQPTDVSALNLAQLERQIKSDIQVGGSTNVGAAMDLAFLRARQQSQKPVQGQPVGASVENRIILISDAGHNTGADRASIARTVNDAALYGIGTTAIGLGLNFEQSLVESFTNAKGGNYVFVNNGEKMYHLFDRFEFLIQPVAEDFRVAIEMQGLGDAKIERAWGINARPGDQSASFVVPTLFFVNTDEGGGAMVLAIRYGTPDGPDLPGDGDAAPEAPLSPGPSLP